MIECVCDIHMGIFASSPEIALLMFYLCYPREGESIALMDIPVDNECVPLQTKQNTAESLTNQT